MWKRIPKYRLMPRLAPPTAHADVDGSRYRPPVLDGPHKRKPHVPLTARTKSARRVIEELEKRRQAKMTPEVANNPLCYVSALIERLPVVMQPMKSWELDMISLQGKIAEDVEKLLPPTILKPTYEENPEWAVDTFKEIFRSQSEALLPMVSPPKVEDPSKTGAASGSAGGGVGSEQKKPEEGKKAKKEKAKKAAQAAPTATAATTDAKPASSAAPAVEEPAWKKAFADFGVELEEEIVHDDDESQFKLHVQLKQKQDDKQAHFAPASRVTEADKQNDTRSLDRKLAEKLYLVVKRKGKWGFPSVKRTAEEGLMAAANRAAATVMNLEERDGDLFFISACPMGYRSGGDAKEFFLRAQLVHGDFDSKLCPTPVEDYAWLNAKEIADLLCKNDSDEQLYFQRMFADDWWQVPDSDELTPILDNLSKLPTKEVKKEDQRARIKAEEERRSEILARLAQKS